MMRATFVPFSASVELNDIAGRAALLNVDEIADEVNS